MNIADVAHDQEIRERLEDLAHALATDGIGPHEVGLRLTARWGRAAGVSTVLVDLLTDPKAPEVARMRAFGKVAAALAAPVPVAERALRVA
jgi:hypothetical protein